jgi:outer membrane protein OmpA-like peptidoglycan-associated protein
MRLYLTLIVLHFCVLCLPLAAQQTSVARYSENDTIGRTEGSFELKSAEEHRVVVHYYTPANETDVSRISNLIGNSINAYLDASVEWMGSRIRFKKSADEMVSDLNEIVHQAIKWYGYKELQSFVGFSEEVKNGIASIARADFEKSIFFKPNTSLEEQKKQQYFFVQKQLNEVKLLANMEVGNFGNSNLAIWTGSEEALLDQATRDSLLEALTFDPNVLLSPSSHTYSPETLALLGMEDQSILPIAEGNGPTSAASSDQVMVLLRANNEKLDGLQNQINDIRSEQIRQWQMQQEQANAGMQAQIENLRTMIVELVKMNGGALASSGNDFMLENGSSEVTNLPESISVFFEKGSTVLNTNAQLSLNEIVEIMAVNPRIKMVITGYADKTGNEKTNLALSQQRAKKVKQVFLESGLDESRFITRYLGDSGSAAVNPEDRKVVLTFVKR